MKITIKKKICETRVINKDNIRVNNDVHNVKMKNQISYDAYNTAEVEEEE